MQTYIHYDQELNTGNLYDACVEAVEGNPSVPMTLSPMSGEPWLIDLIDGLQGHPLAELLDESLAKILRAFPAGKIEVLATAIDSRQGHVPVQEVLTALSRSEEATEAAQSALARIVSKALLDGVLPYSTAIRNHSEKPCTRNWLAAAYLCLDHGWAMEQLPSWLDNDEEDMLLSCMLGALTHGELLALKEEIAESSASLPASKFDTLSAQLERVSKLQDFIDRGKSVRWK